MRLKVRQNAKSKRSSGFGKSLLRALLHSACFCTKHHTFVGVQPLCYQTTMCQCPRKRPSMLSRVKSFDNVTCVTSCVNWHSRLPENTVRPWPTSPMYITFQITEYIQQWWITERFVLMADCSWLFM